MLKITQTYTQFQGTLRLRIFDVEGKEKRHKE